MFFYESQSCPVCGKPFAETDDIVSCPECGAPHHRACWLAEGHCHFADKHGTPEQWQRPEPAEQPAEPPVSEEKNETVATCPHCGKENPTFAEFCSRCGRPLKAREWSAPQGGPSSYTPFHAPMHDESASIPRNTPLDDDGTTVGDAALAIGNNQRYYLPRFRKMYEQGSLVSWNWVAGLFPAPWLFFRKSYLIGALVLLLDLAFNTVLQLVMLEPTMALNNLTNTAANMNELMQGYLAIAERVPSSAQLLSLLWWGLHIFCGLFGNYMYRFSVLSRCRRLKRDYPSDYEARLPIEGGVTMALFVLAWLVVELFPQIICNLIVYFSM